MTPVGKAIVHRSREMSRKRGAYLMDVESRALLQRGMSVLAGIARGESAVADGGVLTHVRAEACMARWPT